MANTTGQQKLGKDWELISDGVAVTIQAQSINGMFICTNVGIPGPEITGIYLNINDITNYVQDNGDSLYGRNNKYTSLYTTIG